MVDDKSAARTQVISVPAGQGLQVLSLPRSCDIHPLGQSLDRTRPCGTPVMWAYFLDFLGISVKTKVSLIEDKYEDLPELANLQKQGELPKTFPLCCYFSTILRELLSKAPLLNLSRHLLLPRL